MDALLIVDFQNDFTPGGALPVADEIAAPINALLESFDLVIATARLASVSRRLFVGVEVDPGNWRAARTLPPSGVSIA